jgi:hypothetical protein
MALPRKQRMTGALGRGHSTGLVDTSQQLVRPPCVHEANEYQHCGGNCRGGELIEDTDGDATYSDSSFTRLINSVVHGFVQ